MKVHFLSESEDLTSSYLYHDGLALFYETAMQRGGPYLILSTRQKTEEYPVPDRDSYSNPFLPRWANQ